MIVCNLCDTIYVQENYSYFKINIAILRYKNLSYKMAMFEVLRKEYSVSN